jgi:subtilisin family serine protease
VAPLLAAGAAERAEVAEMPTARIEWQGKPVEVVAERWIAGVAAGAAPRLPNSWVAESLGEGLHAVSAPGASTADVLAWAAAHAEVAFVEPDFVVAPQLVPDDPSFARQWGLENAGATSGLVGADIAAVEAWDVTTGSRDVVVAVIDTGVDIRHPDLVANIWRNPGEIPGDGIDNDRNGFVDDVHGWNFTRRNANPHDDNGHGTHVAGTIGAVGNNGLGVAGIAWQVSILPLKFLDRNGSGSTSAAVAAINYATRMRRDFGVSIVATNNSWGGAGSSAALRAAIDAGGEAGILFVAAAGNDGTDNDRTPSFPASYRSEAVIAVAATDRSDRLATFSNVGLTSVDIAAPGVAILSTAPNARYATFSGTSMATPHVSGTLALLAAAQPTADAATLRTALLESVRPVPDLAGRIATGGVVDAAAALERLLSGEAAEPSEAVDPAPETPAPAGPSETSPPEPPSPTPPGSSGDVGDLRRTALPIPQRSGDVTISGRIGDGRFGRRDVDLYRVKLVAGQRLVVDVAARSLPGGSQLDSVATIFRRTGKKLAVNDDRADSFDSLLTFRAGKTGTYFVGISGFGNTAYKITRASRRGPGSTGAYEVTLRFGSPPAPRGVPQVLGFPDALTAFAAFGTEPTQVVNEHPSRFAVAGKPVP